MPSLRDPGTLFGAIGIFVACIALGMTLVIISRSMDLSVGSTAALFAVLAASAIVADVPAPLAGLIALDLGRAAASPAVRRSPMPAFRPALSRWAGSRSLSSRP